MELKTKETEKQVGRAGRTKTTSVSLSKEFSHIIHEHNISPTEAIRKGIAIELFERGLIGYTNPTNKERFNKLKDLFIKSDLEELKEKWREQNNRLIDSLEKVLSILKENHSQQRSNVE
jgi:hypothetical protein